MGLKCPDTAAIILVELIKTLEAAVRFYSRRTINNIPPGRFVVDIIREIIIHDDDHKILKGHDDDFEKGALHTTTSELSSVFTDLFWFVPVFRIETLIIWTLIFREYEAHIISSIGLSFAIRYLVYNVNNGGTKITCNFSIIKLDI